MTALSEWDSKRRLGAALPRPAEVLARSRAEAQQFAANVNGPIVAKASGVAHKTEGGLVRLGLRAADVGAAWDALAAAGDGTVLLAEQIEAELELIVGGYRDPGFGPLVTVGIGGIAAEIFGDVVAILAPPEPGEVAAAVGRLAGHRLLAGVRGAPAVDLDALERIVGAVSELLISDPRVTEVDCNPVMVRRGVPLVADALVVLNGTDTQP
ncbi:MAG: acetate--CoA ligase family protein [Gammaproteobacteria bacterium]|nr:acetate--CoA ligase family protein [Gammaproteobacteria bacterium]